MKLGGKTNFVLKIKILPRALPFSLSLESKLWHSSWLRTVGILLILSRLTSLNSLLQHCHQRTQAHNRTDSTRPGHDLPIPGLQTLLSAWTPRPQSQGKWPGYSCQLWDRELGLAQAWLATQKTSSPSPSKPGSCPIASATCRPHSLCGSMSIFSVTCDAVARLLNWNFSQETRSIFHPSFWAPFLCLLFIQNQRCLSLPCLHSALNPRLCSSMNEEDRLIANHRHPWSNNSVLKWLHFPCPRYLNPQK